MMKAEIILSTIVAISTAIYTAVSLMLWWESRETRRQKLAPHIIAFLKSTEDSSTLKLHIKNIGEGVARNVRINVLKDYNIFNQSENLLSNIGIMKNGFNLFPPQYELGIYIDDMDDSYKRDKAGSIKLEIEYKNSYNKKCVQIFDLEFNQIYGQGLSNPPESFIGRIPHYLKEINLNIAKISNKL